VEPNTFSVQKIQEEYQDLGIYITQFEENNYIRSGSGHVGDRAFNSNYTKVKGFEYLYLNPKLSILLPSIILFFKPFSSLNIDLSKSYFFELNRY